MTSHRFLLAAIDASKVVSFPNNSLSRIWDKRLQPLKMPLINRAGTNLYSINLMAFVDTPPTRDFVTHMQDLGYHRPNDAFVRFLATDVPAQILPNPAPPHELLICIEDAQPNITWDAHPNNAAVCRIRCPMKRMPEVVWDVMFDMAIGHEYLISRQLEFLAAALGGYSKLYEEKAAFLRASITLPNCVNVHAGSPYASYSYVARNNRKFGTWPHALATIQIWDQFIVKQLTSHARRDAHRMELTDWLFNHPKFKKRLRKTALTRAIAALAPGVHFLIVRRRSLIRSSPKHRNAVYALFSRLQHRQKAGLPFGFLPEARFDQQTAKVVQDGAVYAVRVHVGG